MYFHTGEWIHSRFTDMLRHAGCLDREVGGRAPGPPNALHRIQKRKKRSRTRDYDSKLSTVLRPIDGCLERDWNDAAEAELSQFGANRFEYPKLTP